jgi:uncharacterized protein Yka (UPF0111/DUF47 family)
MNDKFTHNLFYRTWQNLSFDREDIHALASALDDIADYIYASAKKIRFYRVDPNDIGIQNLVI